MKNSPRRSWLLATTYRQEDLGTALRSAADVVVLDLIEFVPDAHQAAARAAMPAAIQSAAAAGKEVFAQVHVQSLPADLQACVWPGLNGIVLSRAETVDQVKEAERLLARLEAERGLVSGSVQLLIACETAQGNVHAYELAKASSRVCGLTLGRADLIMDLRPEPSGELHLMQHLMQRLVTVAGAAGVAPIGAWWRHPDRGLLATPANTLEAARRGRAIGFRGAMCLRADQAEPLNTGYAPVPDEANAVKAVSLAAL